VTLMTQIKVTDLFDFKLFVKTRCITRVNELN
jgi:hypothetical protein